MAEYFDMTGKVVLITGGSRGLGLEMAKAFTAQGARIIITSRKAESCAAAVAEIVAQGGEAIALPGHVGEWAGLDDLAERAWAAFGRIDVLVNNAGISPVAPDSASVSEALFDKIVGVNFKGPFRLTALLAPRMIAAGGGCVINVSSLASLKPSREYPVYAGAKSALNIITQSHALEYGPSVRVNCIVCGPFRTDIATGWADAVDSSILSGAGRIGRPEEIATTALYLASPKSSYTTGALIRLDGYVDEYRA